MILTASLSVHQVFGLVSSHRQHSHLLSSRGTTLKTHVVTVCQAHFPDSGGCVLDSVTAPDMTLSALHSLRIEQWDRDRITAMDTHLEREEIGDHR